MVPRTVLGKAQASSDTLGPVTLTFDRQSQLGDGGASGTWW